MVVCGDTVGDTDDGAAATFRLAERRRGGRQLPPARRRHQLRCSVDRRRVVGDVRSAGHLSAGDLRPDVGVLACRGAPETGVPRDTHVPAA